MKKKPIAARLQRIAHAEVERALDCLRPRDGSHVDVHDCRKTFKRLRALLRIIRQPLGKKRFRRHNRLIRDLGKRLSDWRDREVMVETVVYLQKKNADDLHLRRPLERLRRKFADDRDAGLESRKLSKIAGVSATELEPMKGWIDAWEFGKSDGFDLIEAGLLRTYNKARRGLATAAKDPSDENLHEWRKRVKYLWTQCMLFVDLLPKPLRARAKRLKHLSDLLGHDHDLAVLLERSIPLVDDPADRAALEWSCGVRRSVLQKHAFKQGEKIYTESPAEWLKPLKKALS